MWFNSALISLLFGASDLSKRSIDGNLYSLCDVAAGVLVSRGEHKGVTLSSNMNFLHPSRGTKLRAEGRIVKKGRTIVLIEASVFDDTGRMTARGSFEIFALE